MLSIPRDTLAYIPNYRSAKINTAFKVGGPDLFRQTILYNFGINVDYYAVVNFSAVVNGVDTLEGIDVVATCPLFHIFPKDPYYFADESNPNIVTRPIPIRLPARRGRWASRYPRRRLIFHRRGCIR